MYTNSAKEERQKSTKYFRTKIASNNTRQAKHSNVRFIHRRDVSPIQFLTVARIAFDCLLIKFVRSARAMSEGLLCLLIIIAGLIFAACRSCSCVYTVSAHTSQPFKHSSSEEVRILSVERTRRFSLVHLLDKPKENWRQMRRCEHIFVVRADNWTCSKYTRDCRRCHAALNLSLPLIKYSRARKEQPSSSIFVFFSPKTTWRVRSLTIQSKITLRSRWVHFLTKMSK